MAVEATAAREKFDALVKGRVPGSYANALARLAADRQKQFARYSEADALRDALTFFFTAHPQYLKNGKGRA